MVLVASHLFLLGKLEDFKVPFGQSILTFSWLIVAYFLGFVMQDIATFIQRKAPRVIKEPGLSGHEGQILEEARKHFGKDERTSPTDIYSLCFMASLDKDTTGLVGLYAAYYGFYRGCVIVFAANSLFMLYRVVCDGWSVSYVFALAISVAVTALLRRGVEGYCSYWRRKTLQVFESILRDKK